jgi:Cft2 family RNA processing exonuclease
MSELLTADVSIEIDGTTYEGRYTVNIKHQLLTVISEYGRETTYTSVPSGIGTPLEDNKGQAKRILRQIVDKFLREMEKK